MRRASKTSEDPLCPGSPPPIEFHGLPPLDLYVSENVPIVVDYSTVKVTVVLPNTVPVPPQTGYTASHGPVLRPAGHRREDPVPGLHRAHRASRGATRALVDSD